MMRREASQNYLTDAVLRSRIGGESVSAFCYTDDKCVFVAILLAKM